MNTTLCAVRRVALAALAAGLVLAGLAPSSDAAPRPDAGVAARRLGRLRRGINTSHWFAQVFDKRGYTGEHFAEHMTARDFDAIRAIGFDHVRLSVEPAPLLDEASPAAIRPEPLRHLDRAVRELLARRLAVVVDIHPASEFKKRLATDDAFVETFAAFWRALAAHYARLDPESVFFEVLNEPEFSDPYRWGGVQARLVRAIREGAPRHTIIATGSRWSAVDRLLLLEPVADRNVIYTFHFYESHTFTHQGATWGASYWPRVKGLDYPSSPESVAAGVARLEDDEARGALRAYGEERWGPARIAAEVAKAARWARRHGVPLYCGEFGVYRAYTPPASRAAWIRDTRAALERHGVGWAMWDYAGSFGVVTRRDGRIETDRAVAAALGLGRRRS
jgi:endoglucanase